MRRLANYCIERFSQLLMTDTQVDWENCKENVLPIKKGRSLKKLGESTLFQVKDFKQQEEENELELRQIIESNDGQRIFEKFLSNFKWIRDTFPTNNEKALDVLEVTYYSIRHQAYSNRFGRDVHFSSKKIMN